MIAQVSGRPPPPPPPRLGTGRKREGPGDQFPFLVLSVRGRTAIKQSRFRPGSEPLARPRLRVRISSHILLRCPPPTTPRLCGGDIVTREPPVGDPPIPGDPLIPRSGNSVRGYCKPRDPPADSPGRVPTDPGCRWSRNRGNADGEGLPHSSLRGRLPPGSVRLRGRWRT